MFVPLAPAAQNLGMLGAMARIAPPQFNEAMARISPRF
jgi:hypothetical protein